MQEIIRQEEIGGQTKKETLRILESLRDVNLKNA
jgi:hypothetical protein